MAIQRMRSRVKIAVEGIAELQKACKTIDNQVRNILSDAVIAGANIVRDDAKRRAPIDTGALREGIKAKITWDKNKSKAFAGVGMDASMNDVFVKYSANGKRYYYPASIEYGTTTAPARPFMRPALKAKRAQVRKIVAEQIRKTIERGG